jgi:biotin carboxyl carrier protein
MGMMQACVNSATYVFTYTFNAHKEFVIKCFEHGIYKRTMRAKVLDYEHVTGLVTFQFHNTIYRVIVDEHKRYNFSLNFIRYDAQLNVSLKPFVDHDDRLHEKKKQELLFSNELLSPLSGRVITVHVQQDDEIVQGQQLVTIESMKMENVICAVSNGFVKNLLIAPGDLVKQNQKLITFKSTGVFNGSVKTNFD